jgi:hypothetical protein
MKRLLTAAVIATVAALPIVAHATPVTVTAQGYYTLATSGPHRTRPLASSRSAPAASVITMRTAWKRGTSPGSKINFSVDVPTVGSTTKDFLEFDPASTSGINCSPCNSHNDIVSEAVTATFHFTQPTGDSVAAVVTGEFYANYKGKLDSTQGGTNPINCGDSGNPADCIVWNSGTPFTATFGNGDVLTVG